MLDDLDTLTLTSRAGNNIIRRTSTRSRAMGANNLLRDLELDRFSRIQLLECHFELHADLGSTTFLLGMRMTRSATSKELGKDVERVVESALALLLLLLQTFFSVAVVDALLFLVRKNLVCYIVGGLGNRRC